MLWFLGSVSLGLVTWGYSTFQQRAVARAAADEQRSRLEEEMRYRFFLAQKSIARALYVTPRSEEDKEQKVPAAWLEALQAPARDLNTGSMFAELNGRPFRGLAFQYARIPPGLKPADLANAYDRAEVFESLILGLTQDGQLSPSEMRKLVDDAATTLGEIEECVFQPPAVAGGEG